MVGRALFIAAALPSTFWEAGWWIIVGSTDLARRTRIVRATGWRVGAVSIVANQSIRATVTVAAASWCWLAKPLCAVTTGRAIGTTCTCAIRLAGTRDTATAVFTACLVCAIRVDRTATQVVEIETGIAAIADPVAWALFAEVAHTW